MRYYQHKTVCRTNIDSGTRWQINDAAGKPLYTWNSRGHQTKYTYDALQRPLQTELTENGNTYIVEKTVYGTDPSKNNIGQIAEQYDQSGKIEFSSYDFKGNPLTTKKTFTEEYKNYINWSGNPSLQNEVFTHLFEYDALNRLVSKTLPDGAVETYTYNKAGLLETVENNGQLYVKNINYNEKGQRTLIKYGNNSTTEYFYDANTFRLIQLKSRRTGHNQTLQDLHYTYDSVGNIVEIFDASQETSYYNNAPIEARKRYTYDALYRLLTGEGRELIGLAQATGGGYIVDGINAADTQAVHKYTQEFEYDELGNILKVKHITTGNVYNWTRDYVYATNTNRLLKHNANQTIDDYTYDQHGNMLSMPHLNSMLWDYKDELKEVSLNTNGDKAYYIYDSGGSRVRKVVEKGNIKEERYYLGDYEVYRKFVNDSQEIERNTTHIMDDKDRIAIIDKETNGQTTIRYQLSDHLGSSSIELDENANIISYEEYHPFGTTSYQKHNTDISQKRYKYTGKEKDEETGLYYYGARYYAAWIARFVSIDPLQFDYPQLTPYNYAGNKPITHLDIDGMQGTGDYIMKADKTNVVRNPINPEKYRLPTEADYLVSKLKESPPQVLKPYNEIGVNEEFLQDRNNHLKLAKEINSNLEVAKQLHPFSYTSLNSDWANGPAQDPFMQAAAEGLLFGGMTSLTVKGLTTASQFFNKGRLVSGMLKGMEYTNKAIDLGNKTMIRFPKIVRGISEIPASLSKGPDIISLPGKMSLFSEVVKYGLFYSENKEYIDKGIKETKKLFTGNRKDSIHLEPNIDSSRFIQKSFKPVENK